MEPKGSLLYSQEPATILYSEPVESSKRPISQRSILILSSHLRLGPRAYNWSLPFRLSNYKHFVPSSHLPMCYIYSMTSVNTKVVEV
jgi:hypothetical protein